MNNLTKSFLISLACASDLCAFAYCPARYICALVGLFLFCLLWLLWLIIWNGLNDGFDVRD